MIRRGDRAASKMVMTKRVLGWKMTGREVEDKSTFLNVFLSGVLPKFVVIQVRSIDSI